MRGKLEQEWWAGPDLNRRPPPRKGFVRRVERPEIEDYRTHLLVKKRLSSRTIQDSVQAAERLLKQSNYTVSANTLEAYMSSYIDGSPSTYNGQLVRLRRFMDYLDLGELIEDYVAAPVPITYSELPTTAQVRKGFEAQRTPERRAYFIFTATTGLRRGEILGLEREKVSPRTRCVIPEHYTPTKRSGITFYSEEAEPYVNPYIEGRPGDLFTLSDRENRKVWDHASRAAGFRITPQVLRSWQSTELGELGVPDRFVDIFQGRAPRTTLAKHYTSAGIARLKRIYDKAELRILG